MYVVFQRWFNVKLATLRMRWYINSLKHVETMLKLGFQPFDAISTIAQRWFNVECSLEYVDIELSNYSEKFSFLAASWLLSKALLIHRRAYGIALNITFPHLPETLSIATVTYEPLPTFVSHRTICSSIRYLIPLTMFAALSETTWN